MAQFSGQHVDDVIGFTTDCRINVDSSTGRRTVEFAGTRTYDGAFTELAYCTPRKEPYHEATFVTYAMQTIGHSCKDAYDMARKAEREADNAREAVKEAYAIQARCEAANAESNARLAQHHDNALRAVRESNVV